MKEIKSRQVFLRQLKNTLRLKYSKDEIDHIITDYSDFFDIEISQGKTEKDICMSLGSPAIIVQNLNQEMFPNDSFIKNIVSRKTIVQSIFIGSIGFIIASVIYRLNHGYDRYIMSELLISFPVIVILLWLVLIKTKRSMQNTKVKNDLMKIIVAHFICFMIVLFLFIFLNNVGVEMNQEQIGKSAVGLLYIFVALLCGMILFSSFQIKRDQIAFYSVIFHALGVLNLILYYINLLHSLTSLRLYSSKLIESGVLYLETIIVVFIFFVLIHKRKKLRWMHK